MNKPESLQGSLSNSTVMGPEEILSRFSYACLQSLAKSVTDVSFNSLDREGLKTCSMTIQKPVTWA